MSNFAKNQLLKYGWTEGKGLGKNENGMVEALKPQLKFDTTGIGHDRSEYHWWEHVYNKASSNIEIKKSTSSEVQLNIKDTDAVEIVTSQSDLALRKMIKNRDLHLGSFIKTSTLQDGKSVEDENKASFRVPEAMEKLPVLTDEEIFKACGGRTAHKGARHGLKLTGKLARIERQERDLIEKRKKKNTDWTKIEKKKRKRKHDSMDSEASENEILKQNRESSGKNGTNGEACYNFNEDSEEKLHCYNFSDEDERRKKSKKAMRKEKRKLDDLTQKLISLEVSENPHEGKKRKKSKKSSKEEPEKKRRKKGGVKVNNGENNNLLNFNPENIPNVVQDRACDDDGFVSGGSADNQPVVSTTTSKMAKGLNYKINKKKKKQFEKKERKKLEKLTEELGTLGLSTSPSCVVDISEHHKKKKKKSEKEREHSKK